MLHEKRLGGYWNVDVSRSLSDSWTGFTKYTLLWSGVETDKNSSNYQIKNLWPEMWSGLSKTAQRKEMLWWADEKPKLDNAPRFRGIYFIDPEDGEYKETIKNARKKLEVPIEAAMFCK